MVNWQDVYRRYEAGVWAVPLALLPSFLLTAVFGQPSNLEPLIELVIAYTPLPLAHLVLNLLGPLARPLALLGATAISMVCVGVLSIITPPVQVSDTRPMLRVIRWLLFTIVMMGIGIYLASFATNGLSAFSAVFASVLCVPVSFWTRRWRSLRGQGRKRRQVMHLLLGTPIVTTSLFLLAGYELWSNLAVRLFDLGNPVRRLFAFTAPRPRQPGFPVAGVVPEVTPVSQFYVNGKDETDPLLLAQDWELRISGLVHTPLTLTFQQLLALPRTNYYATMRCVDNPVDGHLMSTAYWSGVRMLDILALAQPTETATTLLLRGADQYTEPFALKEPSLDDVLLAYAMNGETLLQQHGAPVRVLLPGWYGFRNVKWVQEIVVTSGAVNGYWEQSGWQAKQIHAVARIDVVHQLDTTHIVAAGVAFGGLRGLSRVQVRIDGGGWQDAILNIPALSPYTWVQWQAMLTVQQRQVQLTARMIDASGMPQDATPQGPYPSGSSGLQTLQITLL